MTETLLHAVQGHTKPRCVSQLFISNAKHLPRHSLSTVSKLISMFLMRRRPWRNCCNAPTEGKKNWLDESQTLFWLQTLHVQPLTRGNTDLRERNFSLEPVLMWLLTQYKYFVTALQIQIISGICTWVFYFWLFTFTTYICEQISVLLTPYIWKNMLCYVTFVF